RDGVHGASIGGATSQLLPKQIPGVNYWLCLGEPEPLTDGLVAHRRQSQLICAVIARFRAALIEPSARQQTVVWTEFPHESIRERHAPGGHTDTPRDDCVETPCDASFPGICIVERRTRDCPSNSPTS